MEDQMTALLEAIATAIDRNTAEQRGIHEELVQVSMAIQELAQVLREK